MITTVKHALRLTYFYLISPRSWLTAPGWRNYCGLLGWGDFTTQTTLLTLPVGETRVPGANLRLSANPLPQAEGNRCGLMGWGDFTTLTTLLTLPMGGNRSTRMKSTTVGRAFTNFSRTCHESEVGIEPTISEVTGACSDDCATWSLLCRTKQSYTRNLNSLALARVSL